MKNDLITLLISPVNVLGLSVRTHNVLMRANINSVLHLVAYTDLELDRKASDFGPKKHRETTAALLRHDLRLGLAGDYREQLESLSPTHTRKLRDIAVCFARDFKPDKRTSKEDKNALASTIVHPLHKKLVHAFTPDELKNPETTAIIEESFDAAIRLAKTKIQSLRP